MSKAGARRPVPPRGSMDWMSRSACLTAAPWLFDELPIRKGAKPTPGSSRRVAEAKKICAGCPVKVDCLLFGIENNESGVRGGQYLSNGVIYPSGRVHATERESA